jgi:hypothetical protein
MTDYFVIKFFAMKKKLRQAVKVGVGIFLTTWCLLSSQRSSAQIYNDSSKKYHLYLEPYLMFTSMSGTTGIGNAPNTFICVPASKVFSYLKIGGMLYAEVHNDKLSFTSDLFYANLTQDASTKNQIVSGTATLKQFWWELEGLYRLNPWLEAGVGARINNITAGINVNATVINPIDLQKNWNTSKSNTWVDPLIVVRMKTVLHEKWLLQLRADVGGFGIASSWAWQLQPDIFYRASKLLQLGIGYRIISMNYSTGSGSSRFLYDMDEYGPQIRIGFNL